MTETPVKENAPAGRGRFGRLAKLVTAAIAALGIVSASIGYITNGARFFTQVSDYFQGRSELHAQIDIAEDRLAHRDFEAAWAANTKALQLAPRDAAAGGQQARIAMKWLENVRLSSAAGPKTFTEVVDPLKAALIQRLPGTHGRLNADMRAHIGWANFLRYRDGRPQTDIAEEFDAAIAEDKDNLYGHAMRGFWSLWNGDIEKARPDLAVAMQSDVDPAYSDGLIMAGLINKTSDDFQAASIEYADAIRLAGRNIDDHAKGQLLWYYSMCLREPNLLGRFTKTLPPSEQVVFLNWLKLGEETAAFNRRVADYFIAHFSELEGKRDEAIRLFTELVNSSEDKANDNLAIAATAQLRRLQKR